MIKVSFPKFPTNSHVVTNLFEIYIPNKLHKKIIVLIKYHYYESYVVLCIVFIFIKIISESYYHLTILYKYNIHKTILFNNKITLYINIICVNTEKHKITFYLFSIFYFSSIFH